MIAAGLLSESERKRLHETFEALCRIESPTGSERECADWVVRELQGFGLEVHEDGAGALVGSDSGNLYSRIPGRGERSVMFCAHLDTVPLAASVDPVVRDGCYENANDGILGADNKATVAVLVELARRVTAAGVPAVGVELVFTVREETGLEGAKAFDVSTLTSAFGYVFDQPGPVGEIVISSPTYTRITAEIRGRAAHAGICPEEGRSAIAAAAIAIAAMPLGRLDPQTTANVGTIDGGTAANVVPERCRLEAEVRSLDEQRLDNVVTSVIDALQDAADAGECDLDLGVERVFSGYRHRPSASAVELAMRALRTVGCEPSFVTSGGGADANAFQSAGFECVNLANGTERPHQPDEFVSIESLDRTLLLAIALLDEAEQAPAQAALAA